jgi:hypothetical protein
MFKIRPFGDLPGHAEKIRDEECLNSGIGHARTRVSRILQYLFLWILRVLMTRGQKIIVNYLG